VDLRGIAAGPATGLIRGLGGLCGLTGLLLLSCQAPASAQPGPDTAAFTGTRISGGPSATGAPTIRPGQYVGTARPGQTLWYALRLNSSATADLAVTAAPRPGAHVAYGDGLELRLATTGGDGYACDTATARFGQDEGAMPLTGAVSRVPDQHADGPCDSAGRYLLSVHRTSAAASDRADWPIELRYLSRPPLPAGTVPAAARTDYGTPPPPLTGTPEDVSGGAGFDDATAIGTGVWRDRVRPGRTRTYKVHVGWGQQLTCAAEFANAPGVRPGAYPSFVAVSAYSPDRVPVHDASDGRPQRAYDGAPVTVGLGTVPVAWTNRWADDEDVRPVREAGDYWITVGLGPGAAQLTSARSDGAFVGYGLRVQVTGRELAGPQYRAPALTPSSSPGTQQGQRGPHTAASPTPTPTPTPAAHADGRAAAGWPGGITDTDLLAVGTGGAVALAAVGGVVLAHTRGTLRTARPDTRTDRSGA